MHLLRPAPRPWTDGVPLTVMGPFLATLRRGAPGLGQRDAHRLLRGRPVAWAGPLGDLAALASLEVAVEGMTSRTRVRSAPPVAEQAIAHAEACLVAALRPVAPEALAGLCGPAWDEDLAVLERSLGHADGGGEEARFDRWKLSTLEEIDDTWHLFRALFSSVQYDGQAAPDPGVAPRWCSPGWIPFASDGAGNHLCIDLAPGPSGAVGQVIEYVHDDGVRPCVARSLAAWLERQADAVAKGTLLPMVHDDGTFDQLSTLSDHAALATRRVRGESSADRRARLERSVLADPERATALVLFLLGRRVRTATPAERVTAVWPAVRAVMARPGLSTEDRARAVVTALAELPGVGCEATAEGLAEAIDAALR